MPNVENRIYLFDTTLRDGAQTQGVDFTANDKHTIAKALDSLASTMLKVDGQGLTQLMTRSSLRLQRLRIRSSSLLV